MCPKLKRLKRIPKVLFMNTLIYEYFDVKRQVDLRREELKMKIDDCSDDIIKDAEKAKLNCMKLSKEVNQLKKDIDKSKKELVEMIAQFDTFTVKECKSGSESEEPSNFYLNHLNLK